MKDVYVQKNTHFEINPCGSLVEHPTRKEAELSMRTHPNSSLGAIARPPIGTHDLVLYLRSLIPVTGLADKCGGMYGRSRAVLPLVILGRHNPWRAPTSARMYILWSEGSGM